MTGRSSLGVPPGTTVLDVTSSAAQPYTSGIQRVVRALGASASDRGLLLAEFSPQSGQWHLVNPGALLLSGSSSTSAQNLMLRLRQAYHYALQVPGAPRGAEFAIGRFRGLYEIARRSLGGQGLRYGQPLRLEGPSTFFVPEVTSSSQHAGALEGQVLSEGHRLAMFVHDLMPVTHPEWFETDPRHDFGAYVRLIGRAHQVATSSPFVAKELKARISASEPAQIFPLPSFGSAARLAPRGHPHFLVVGAMTRRKNAYGALLAASRLAERGIPTALTFVSHPARTDSSIREALHVARSRGVRVKVRRFLADRQLAAYYQGVTATLCLSLGEGYGLPIVESLAHGTPVIASDRAPMRDFSAIGGVSLVDPDNAEEISEMMARLVEPAFWSHAAAEIRPAAVPIGWDRWAHEVIRWAGSS